MNTSGSRRFSLSPLAVRTLIYFVAAVTFLGFVLRIANIVAGRILLAFGDTDGSTTPATMPQVISIAVDGQQVLLSDVPLYLRVLSASALAVEGAAIVIALLAVARILTKLAEGEPFSSVVQRNLRVVSIVLIVGSLLRWTLDLITINRLVDWWESRPSHGGGLAMDALQLPVTLLICGLIAGAMMVAFRQGAELEEDAAGVV
jgi:hypothetical protein